MFIAKLTGEADSHVVSREFEQERAAISWLVGVGLADFEDQTARGEVWNGNTLGSELINLSAPTIRY